VTNDWTGLYVGVNGGYSWATTQQTDTTGVTSGIYRQRGGLVGGTYGGNWESGKIVAGFEGDFDAAWINGTVANPLCAGGTCFTNLNSFGTERLRFGYDFGSLMAYATGGVIWGNLTAGQDGCSGPLKICGTSHADPGWTVGVGLEWMFAPNWSAKVEWLHYQFAAVVDLYQPAVPVNLALERGDLVRAGINWHFNPFN
jgi:outer membrane immunogenic protein